MIWKCVSQLWALLIWETKMVSQQKKYAKFVHSPWFWWIKEWIFPCGCFQKKWYPQIMNFNRVFHYKPSILGYPYFRKHPCIPNHNHDFPGAITWYHHSVNHFTVADWTGKITLFGRWLSFSSLLFYATPPKKNMVIFRDNYINRTWLPKKI